MHYILMGGLHGCLPQHCTTHDTLADAVEEAVHRYELSKRRQRFLCEDRYLDLNLKYEGNEYLEIEQCDCANPEQHDD